MSAPDLAAFLLARLAEDEVMVRRALDWPTNVGAPSWGGPYEAAPDDPDNSRTDFHLAADPARVLADIEAKRRIVALHLSGQLPLRHCLKPEEKIQRPCVTVRHLATVYSDHPDYREEWKP